MMKMLVVLALSAFVAAEPEADPALLYSGYPYGYAAAGYPYAGPVAYSAPLAYTHHAVAAAPVVTKVEETPAVVSTYNTVAHATPVVYNTVATHAVNPVVYNAAPAVVNPVVYNAAPVVAAAVAPSHTITNYNNPEQYTAHSNGVFGPSYIAKNGPVEHIVKREADAEADAALYYSAGYPYAHQVATPVTYSYGAYPAATYAAHHAVAAPVVTYAANHAVAAPVVTYAANHAIAAPAVTYAANHAVVAPVAGLLKTPDHAVAYTAAGLTHSSNVGVCTNVSGVQVPC